MPTSERAGAGDDGRQWATPGDEREERRGGKNWETGLDGNVETESMRTNERTRAGDS